MLEELFWNACGVAVSDCCLEFGLGFGRTQRQQRQNKEIASRLANPKVCSRRVFWLLPQRMPGPAATHVQNKPPSSTACSARVPEVRFRFATISSSQPTTVSPRKCRSRKKPWTSVQASASSCSAKNMGSPRMSSSWQPLWYYHKNQWSSESYLSFFLCKWSSWLEHRLRLSLISADFVLRAPCAYFGSLAPWYAVPSEKASTGLPMACDRGVLRSWALFHWQHQSFSEWLWIDRCGLLHSIKDHPS